MKITTNLLNTCVSRNVLICDSRSYYKSIKFLLAIISQINIIIISQATVSWDEGTHKYTM